MEPSSLNRTPDGAAVPFSHPGENSPSVGTFPVFPPVYQEKKTVYTGKDFILSLFSLLFGYLFCRAFPFFENPMGTALFLLLLTCGSGVFLLLRGRTRRKSEAGISADGSTDNVSMDTEKKDRPRGRGKPTLILFLGLAVFSLSPLLQSGVGMRFLSIFLYFLLFFITLGYAGGCFFEKSETGDAPADLLFFDLVKSILLLPFGKCGMLFPALFRGGKAWKSSHTQRPSPDAVPSDKDGVRSGKRKSAGGRFLLLIFGGFLLALLPTLLAFALLSYDENFQGLVHSMFNSVFSFLKPAAFFSHVADFLLGIPLAMLLYSAAFTLSRREISRGENLRGEASLREDPFRYGDAPAELLSRKSCEKLRREVKFLPLTTSAAVFLPPLLLYLLFFISQSEYYLSAFTGKLPEGFVFSSYAREGFFNLCAVAALNALLLLFLSLFTKKRQDGVPALPERIGGILLSAATLLLIATAMAKMGMYISVYGLSLRRLLASLAMGFLALAFLSVILTRAFASKKRKLRLFPILLCLFFLFSCAFTTVDLKAVVAEYNADAYLREEIVPADPESIAALGESGIPALVRLAKAGIRDRKGRTVEEIPSCRAALRETERSLADGVFLLSFSCPRARARAALEEYGESSSLFS